METYAINQAPGMVAQPTLQNMPPQHAPTPYYPQHVSSSAVTSAATSQIVTAGIFGVIVGATGAMGANLRKVNSDDMTFGDAFSDSMVKGAGTGVAVAAATAASTTLTSGGVAGLAVMLATATGVSYLFNKG